MRCKTLLFCALLVAFAASARAQGPANFPMQCGAVTVSQIISSSSGVSTKNCTTTATINGVAFKGLTFSFFQQNGPAENRVWGLIVGTLANGDQIYFKYQNVLPVRNGVAEAGNFTYQIVGGTGTVAGIAGSGSCKVLVSPTGAANYDCAGVYATR